MSQLREVIELVFVAGHAAGVVDATEERECEIPLPELGSAYYNEISNLVIDAKRMLGLK